MNYQRPKILTLLAWLHGVLLFAAVYPFLAGFLKFTGNAFFCTAAAGTLLFIPVAVSWFLLQHVLTLFPFALCGIITSVPTVLLSYCLGGIGTPSGKVCAVTAFICTMTIFGIRIYTKTIYGRMKKSFYEVHDEKEPFDMKEHELRSPLNQPQLYHWIWFTFLYLLGMLLHHTLCLYILFGIQFADILICLAYKYINSLYEYVLSNRKVANLPIQTMYRIHRLTGILGALLLILFLLPSLVYGREFLPNLKSEKSSLTYEDVMQEDNTEPMDPEVTSTQIAAAIESDIRTTPEWLRTLIKFMGYLMSAAILIGIVAFIIRKLCSIGRDFATPEEDVVVFLNASQRDNKTRGRRHTSSLSENQQIRRRYRRLIRKETKGRPDLCATPSELEENAALENTEETRTLHRIYEKARYGKNL